MNYKPDESTLISWLYDELEGDERAKVERYLNEHPEELKRLRAMSSVRNVMANIEEQEVIAPPVFMDHQPNVLPLWRSTWFRSVTGIAASFIMVILVGKLTGAELSISSSEFRIAFGEKKQSTQPAEALTAMQVQQMIDESVMKTGEQFAARLTENREELDNVIRKHLAVNSVHINDAVQKASMASQAQVRAYVATLHDENIRSVRDYMQLTSAEQKKYTENLLVDFSKWLQEQRNQDLQLFQVRLNDIEKNTNEFKQETEQILASIISGSGEALGQSNY